MLLRWLKTVYSTFQDVDFDGSLLPLYQLMLQSWYQKTAQSPMNTLVSFSQRYDLLKTPLTSALSAYILKAAR